MDIILKHGIGALLHETDPILQNEPASWIFDPPQADA